jgi:hypothetical protein
MTLNSDGHRGRPTDWSQPVLLAVGDSQGFGIGVADDEVYTAVLETMLRQETASPTLQVVNASGLGFGPHHHLVMFRRALRAHALAALLVRVSIEDRFMKLAEGDDLKHEIAAARRRLAIRRITKFLPHLVVKARIQLPSIRTAFTPWFMRPSGSAGTPFTPAIGQQMWDENKAYWEEMASRTSAKRIPIIFFLDDPRQDQASAVLWQGLNDLRTRFPHCHLLRLGPESFHLDTYSYGQLTLEESTGDPHANALQHRFVARALSDFLQKQKLVPTAPAAAPPSESPTTGE